ncbi:MAG TPA: bi-domain-containing oxidoreductase [Terriglobales bacterium]|nr:bi-domain-containing oxidoreductase [Terriglobales bacterium]
MKQLLQSARTGRVEVAEVPVPAVPPGCVLVRIATSLVSAGTERASYEFASKGLLQKARLRPDLMREVVSKVRRDGLFSAVTAVRSRLDQPIALGYSSAGTIVQIGERINDLQVGDRVACAGANFAVHAEFACVPRMLVARISSADVDFDSAAFTTLGAVAIHGMRTAEAKLGDVVAVIGLGLLGQITLQILNAAGCRVIGIDPIQDRVDLAARMGACAATASEAEFRDLSQRHSSGHGVDSVLITAETGSSGPVNLASEVARDRGIVAAVGTVGLELQRKLYYEKELDFRVSRSYGPGRYDAAFEQQGRDYPIGYVRWSETRNMEAFLQLLADGKLDMRPLITHSFALENADAAYELITGRVRSPHLGILLRYCEEELPVAKRIEICTPQPGIRNRTKVAVGVLGAGNFAQGTLIPAMRASKQTQLVGLCASSGARVHSAAAKFGFRFCTSDEQQIYSDPAINAVVIATRHHLHAQQVVRALEAGKHVFCEKPLCLTEDELQQIEAAYRTCDGAPRLMVGFNRRFAATSSRMKVFLSQTGGGPFLMHYRVNAGPLFGDHWVKDPEQGGGRILSEVCHFVDLLSFVCEARPETVHARTVLPKTGEPDVEITISFSDGSLGTISYICNSDRSF